MTISLNSINQESLDALEKGEIEPVLYKGSPIEFIYNKLNLGVGKLYILQKRLIWINENKLKKKKVTNFNEISTNTLYLNHYEKNKEFYMHLLNDVNNISIDSSKIALHATSLDKNFCDHSCIYIQLNTDINDHIDDEKGEDKEDADDSLTNYNKKNDEENNSDGYENYNETIVYEILLTSKNESENDLIFCQLSNMDNCLDDEDEYGEDDCSSNESSYSSDEKKKV